MLEISDQEEPGLVLEVSKAPYTYTWLQHDSYTLNLKEITSFPQ